MLRIVIDTNLFVSGIISPKGTSAKLISSWQASEFQFVTCQKAVDELNNTLQSRKLVSRYNIQAADREKLIDAIRHLAIFVEGNTITGVVDDPKDDIFVACAVEGDAKYIVTGDDDLLRLKRYETIRIIKTAYFLRVLERCQRS